MAMLLLMSLFAVAPVRGHEPMQRIDRHFRVQDFEQDGDGFRVTVRNHSKRGFSDVTIVFLGQDLDYVTVYQNKVEVKGFVEGQSERTYFLPDFDERVESFDIHVFDRTYPVDRSHE
jgi:hypothetical protein